jgi:uncharacterized protein DUF1932
VAGGSAGGLEHPRLESARLGLEREWRWAFELEEIGRTFAGAGLPDGFGVAAAEVYGRLPRAAGSDLETALSLLTTRSEPPAGR